MNKPQRHADEEDLDGCGCDRAFDAALATADEELPSAAGGVQAEAAGADETAVDGCDLDFSTAPATADEDLPAATGGVLQ